MPLADDIREFTPGNFFREGNPTTLYWIRGDTVLYRSQPLKRVDISSFRFYLGSFAKDCRHCYCGWSRLAGGNGPTFRALNFTYATDGQLVWTIGGRIKDVDASSFEVCDDGFVTLIRGERAPYGYGKDRIRVFYYDFDGKPNWVRKANPQSFVSLNDGQFGIDEKFVFCGAAVIPKANVQHWKKIGGYYSKDDKRVFYWNRQIREADYESFVPVPSDFLQIARDNRNCYWNDEIVSPKEFEKLVRGE